MLIGKSVQASAAAAKAMNDLGKATAKTGKETKKAEKEAKGFLATFDEINQISKELEDTDIDVDDLIGGGEAGGPDFSGIENIDMSWLDGLFEKLRPTIDALSELWETLKMVGGFAWDNLLNFYDAFLVPVGNWLMGDDGLPRFVGLINEMLLNIDWEKINKSLEGLYEQLSGLAIFAFDAMFDFFEFFLKPLGEWVMGEAFPRFVDAISNILANVDWDKINGALERMWQALLPFAIKVGEGLLWFFENVISPLVTWAMNALIPAALDLITAAIDALSAIIDAAKPALLWFWDTFLVPIRDFVWDLVIGFINMLTDAFKALSAWAAENPEDMEYIADLILGFLAGLWVYNSTKMIIDFIKDLIKVFKEFGGLEGMLNAMGAAINSPAVALGVLTAAALYWIKNWEGISASLESMSVWEKAAVYILTLAAAVAVFWTATTAGAAAATILAGLLTLGLGAAILGFGKVRGVTADSESEGISPANAQSGYRNAMQGVSLAGIPMLATGTVVPPNREFYAILGDNKQEHEVVSPVSTIKQAVAEVLTEIGFTSGEGSLTTPVVVNFDGNVLYQGMQKISKQRGFAQEGMVAFPI